MGFVDIFVLFVVYPFIRFKVGQMLYRGFGVEFEKETSRVRDR